jgi:hypothetical protein
MIISHKYKYIFVGLPLSGSSAISKELIENYEGESILKKHSNIPDLLMKNKEINIDDYFVFGVFRDPIEITYSRYFKLKNNAKGVYTDTKHLKANGGNISKRRLRLQKKITSKNWTFSDYIESWPIPIPYDGNFSLNKKYFSYVITFNNLSEGFENALLKCGITPIRSLPVYNKTEKKDKSLASLTDKEIVKYYSPFIYQNKMHIYKDYNINSVNRLSYFIFLLFKPVRFLVSLARTYRGKNEGDEYFGNL